MFSNTKIRSLLSGGFGIIIALIVIMVAVIYLKSSAVTSHITRISDDAYPKMTAADEIRVNVMRNWSNTLLLHQITDAAENRRITDEMAANSKAITAKFEFLVKTVVSEKGRKQLAAMQTARTNYTESRKQYLGLVKTGNKDEANRFLTGTLTAKLAAYDLAIAGQFAHQSDKMVALNTETLSLANSLKTINLALALLIVLVAITTAVIIVRVIGHALGGEVFYAGDIARQISSGNLNVEVLTAPGDNTSLLASMKTMRDRLREMVSSIDASASQVGLAARDLVQASDSVAASSARQSQATSATATAVEKMSAGIGQIADSANEARTLSASSENMSRKGSAIIRNAAAEMGKTADSVEASSAIIGTLEQQSNEISAVVKVIKEIADQTNLLALNAAIEAARAGEQGRGFAVVADEVRKLAERTALSTKEITTTIEKIQGGTKDAVHSMISGVEQVRSGTALAQQAGESIVEIESGTQRVVSVVNDISHALQAQTSSSTEIAHNLDDISAMVDENNAAAAKAAGAAHLLEELADSLSKSIRSFRL